MTRKGLEQWNKNQKEVANDRDVVAKTLPERDIVKPLTTQCNGFFDLMQ